MQLLDAGDRRVGRIAHAENDFVLGIVLQAVAAEALVNVRVCTLQRLEDGDWRQEDRSILPTESMPSAKERRRTPQADQIVCGTGQATENRNELKGPEDKVHHARAGLYS